MNMMGADAKIIYPRQVREFRTKFEVHVKQHHGRKPNRTTSMDRFKTDQVVTDPRAAAAMYSYGKANRTQTPVKGIINNTYGIEAEEYYRQQSEDAFARVSLQKFLERF